MVQALTRPESVSHSKRINLEHYDEKNSELKLDDFVTYSDLFV